MTYLEKTGSLCLNRSTRDYHIGQIGCILLESALLNPALRENPRKPENLLARLSVALVEKYSIGATNRFMEYFINSGDPVIDAALAIKEEMRTQLRIATGLDPKTYDSSALKLPGANEIGNMFTWMGSQRAALIMKVATALRTQPEAQRTIRREVHLTGSFIKSRPDIFQMPVGTVNDLIRSSDNLLTLTAHLATVMNK